MNGLNPYYGSELCTDVETIYSMAYNYFAIGDPYYADRAELAAFNALPAALTGDWWAHQYLTEPNQPYSKNLSATPFYDDNSQSITFGLEPNYPCCTVNHPQGFPKFTMYSYLKKGSTGLVHSLLSPGRVQTKINGKSVTVDCQTDYPFANSLKYSIDSETDFQLYLRVPDWSEGVSIKGVDNVPPVDTKTGLVELQIPSGTTDLSYQIEMSPRIAPRSNDTVSVHQGALLYALYITPDISSEAPKYYTNQTAYAEGTYPSESMDYTYMNATEWNVAIDTSTISYDAGSGDLPSPVFEDGALPMSMSAKGCLIDWPLFLGAVPGSPIPKNDRKCLGDSFDVTLRPYGSSKLHMSEIPTIDLSA